MRKRITWRATSDPEVFFVNSKTDSPFQVSKPDSQVISEQTGLAGSVAIEDEFDALPDGRQKVNFSPGQYITLDARGKPDAVVARPKTEIRTPAEQAREIKQAARRAALEKIRAADPSTLTLEDAFVALGMREPS